MADQTNTAGQNNQAALPAPQQEGKWGKRLKTAAKWTGIGMVCAGLGVGGYFAAQAYHNRSN